MTVDQRDVLRVRIAYAITCIWILSFPVSTVIKDFPITWAQGPMLAVTTWLFAAPLIKRNGGS